MPDSTLDGDANLLVCPNQDSANILFNVLKTTDGHGITIGPILLGSKSRRSKFIDHYFFGIPLQYGNGVRETVFQCLQRREQHIWNGTTRMEWNVMECKGIE